MELPTVYLTKKEFDDLPATDDGAWDQPRCKYFSSIKQWILIDRDGTPSGAVIEFDDSKTVDVKELQDAHFKSLLKEKEDREDSQIMAVASSSRMLESYDTQNFRRESGKTRRRDNMANRKGKDPKTKAKKKRRRQLAKKSKQRNRR